ncbi:MAG TPA: type II secretion system F family protein [Rhizomicrobium sp.]|jgi:tight adherence protein B|nr:type II secretion system F family protein [Rhizomicrobium sp.]
MIYLVALLGFVSLGGMVFVFAGGDERSQKRIQALAKPKETGRAVKGQFEAQKRKNLAALLEDVEKNQAAQRKQEKPTLRRRLEQAGFAHASPRSFWIVSAGLGVAVALICLVTRQSPWVLILATFAVSLGLPRWVLGFLTARRKKKFTKEFANAIDVIVRSVRSGLPVNEALRIVARETPDPVGAEFTRLVDGLMMGVSMEQGLKKMHESMPTTEVGFFSTVMNIQSKSGGNLSEALANLAGVLRDRKRLEGKIKAMSSEAKASASIIGSLPPVVMGIVWLTTPNYISLLFTERMGNLMLAACLFWMGTGIMVMRKMINFKL